ncbi:N-acetylglucosamine-6-phosphate deacetylase [Hanamia caeni]|uniref:N-acetylglucosamine-6-phosphate deacetylase n=1 Tax=Hanamia caeni TaxID=2294116 RepID=A0A3M9NE96_9BACT|nr:N-acetylglucosamine-6-phosphate deacetylase [Hanamia caeni]RNI36122.1 N-acetylglucosamine-6-phosphate deacetylase [Hanamia caeni]
MVTTFLNATIYTGKEKIEGRALVIENDIIKGITAKDKIPENSKLIDCTGCIISPGLIDIQIYGAGGFLFSNSPSAPALKSMTESLLSVGTTGFYVTLATNSMQIFHEAIKVVNENPHPAVLGLHFEGPYLNPVKRGAHIPEYIKRAERKEVEELLEAADGALKIMTLAPEMVDEEIIKLLLENGVVVSAGHSNATFEEAVKGYASGITTTTHLFNAMSSMHHRDTGLPGAIYLSKNAYASIIADGIHVDFNALKISKKIMGDRLFLITDAVVPVAEGPYQHVEKKDRFTLPDGTLSGSKLTLLKAVENCVEHAEIPLDEALRMASTYPAQVMRLLDRGKIEPGHKANLTIFSEDFQPKYTVLNGEVISTY